MTAQLSFVRILVLSAQYIGLPGLVVNIRIKRAVDDYYFDNTSMTFMEVPNDYDFLMTESPSGTYIKELEVTEWADGNYIIEYWENGTNIQPDETVSKVSGNPLEVLGLDQEPLYHDHGGTDNLQYIDSGDNPIEGATIRVYLKSDWDSQNFNDIIGATRTNSEGKWISPVYVDKGETYVVVFHKENEFGPNITEVTV